MTGEERRKKIIELLEKADSPLSGGALASEMGVSRQVIVQDIALIRAVNKNLLATNKGYVLYVAENDNRSRRTIRVRHDNANMALELNTIVDFGGQVLDVVVDHDIYGQITVDLIINNRQDVADFCEKIEKYGISPLNSLTNGVHYHTITAATDEVLDAIENALDKKSILYR